MRTASSISGVDLMSKINYSLKLFDIRRQYSKLRSFIPWNEINQYEQYLSKYSFEGAKLLDHQVLEIGYGARPWRLIAMSSLGIDIKGIDLDHPTYGCNPKRLLEVLRRNGFERFAKSLVRGVLFDLAELRKLRNELKEQGKELFIDESRLLVGNAAENEFFESNSFTFAFSEDVFEHIPSSALPKVVKNLKSWLKKGSICIITPHIYTGITGGHDPDYYAYKVLSRPVPQDRAWAHLWDPNFKVNTYLNKLRLEDYHILFSEHFEILETKQKYSQLGKQYLTSAVLKKLLPEYTEEDLLTNQVSFVLRA